MKNTNITFNLKTIITYLLLICILSTMTLCIAGCKISEDEEIIDLQQRFKENMETADSWSILTGRGSPVFISADTATEEQRQTYKKMFDHGVTQIIGVRSSNTIEPFVWAFETTDLAKQYLKNNYSAGLERIQNVIVFDIFLSYILLDDNIISINGYNYNENRMLFIESYVENIVIPDGITHICGYATYLSNAKSIVCNKDLKKISSMAFTNIKTLTSLQLNSGLNFIGSFAFLGASLPYVVIPRSVQYIGWWAFDNTVLYCETKQKPIGWDEQFADQCTIYWAGEWYYVDGVPQPKN